MQITKNHINTKIARSARGAIFFAEDFVDLASSANIRQVLSRLEKEGVITRLAQGIYLKPKVDPALGVLFPGTEEIAEKIAKRDKARIAPTGVLALYLLGLTMQVPLKTVYLTDGSQREVKIGKRSIKFKKAVPQNFAIQDKLLHLIVQAFKETGQNNISDDFSNKIKPSIKKLNKDAVNKQLRYAPVWIQKEILNQYKQ